MRLSDSVIETPRRFSESALWRLQQQAYSEHGPAAWSGGHVPSQVVSNPHFAFAVAQVVAAWLEAAPAGVVVDLVELGSGSGRFAHYLLQALTEQVGPLQGRLRLILTDLATSNLQAWREQPQLRGWFEAGVLRAGRFDAEQDRAVQLEGGGLWPDGPSAVPPLVLVNYLFDSIRSDAFWTEDGVLFEQKVGLLRLPGEARGAAGVKWVEEHHRAALPVYGEPLLDELLAAAALERSCVLLPVGALRCVEGLLQALGGRMWMLVHDKGDVGPESQRGRLSIQLTRHGEMFSTMVNFGVLREHALRRSGGVSFDRGEPRLVSGLFWYGLEEAERAAVVRAHQHAMGTCSALDVERLMQGTDPASTSAATAIALVRLCRCDPFVLVKLRDALMRDPAALAELLPRGLERTVAEVWERRFEAGDSAESLAFDLGSILHRAQRPEAALPYYAWVRCGGATGVAAAYNLAVALDGLGRRAEALQAAQRAVEIAPEREEVRALWRDLGGEAVVEQVAAQE